MLASMMATPKVQLTLRVEHDLHRQVKAQSDAEETDMTTWVVQAIKEYLAKKARKEVAVS